MLEPFFQRLDFSNVTTEDIESFHSLIDPMVKASQSQNLPYVWVDILSSLDGKISFNEQSSSGPFEIGLGHENVKLKEVDFRFLQHSWEQADAVILSSEVLRQEPHLKGCFTSNKKPLQVILTKTGSIGKDHIIFKNTELKCLVAIPFYNKDSIQADLSDKTLAYGNENGANLRDLFEILQKEYDVKRVSVCCGGKIISQLFQENLVCEVRHSIAMHFIGQFNTENELRSSLFSPSSAFDHYNNPKFNLIGIRELDGSVLFLRYLTGFL